MQSNDNYVEFLKELLIFQNDSIISLLPIIVEKYNFIGSSPIFVITCLVTSIIVGRRDSC